MLRFSLVTVTKDSGLKRDIKRLATATGSNATFVNEGGHVDMSQPPDLLVCDVRNQADAPPPSVLGALPAASKVLYITSEQEISKVFDLLNHPRSGGFMCKDDRFDDEEFIVTATKLLRGEVFGVAKYFPWGVTSYSLTLKSYEEKLLAIDVITEYTRLAGCRGPVRERVQLVADELIMNALYHAPVDEHGKERFASIDRKQMTEMAVPPVVVQYACNGRYFALFVKDNFGSLKRDTVLKYLGRAATVEGSDIERKAGGAGLGLLTVLRSVSKLIFNLAPGQTTEVIALFDMELFARGKMGARSLTIFSAMARPQGLPEAPSAPLPAPAVPASQRVLTTVGGILVVVIIAIAGMMILKGKQSTADTRSPTKLSVISNPDQARVFLGGSELPQRTPTEIEAPKVGLQTITLKKAGYRDYSIEVNFEQAMGSVLLKAPLERQ